MRQKQECHGARLRLHGRTVLGALVVASASLGACSDNHGDDSAELQAILHDGELPAAVRNALMAATPAKPGTGSAGTGPAMTGAGGSMTGAAGAAMGAGGSTGAAGAPIPGTGTAGKIGSVGSGGSGFGGAGGGFAGSGGPGGMGGPPSRNLPSEAQGFWRFDDCNMTRTELQDSSFNNQPANRSVTAF